MEFFNQISKLILLCIFGFSVANSIYTDEQIVAYVNETQYLYEYNVQKDLFEKVINNTADTVTKVCYNLENNMKEIHNKYLEKLGVMKVIEKTRQLHPEINQTTIDKGQIVDWLGDCCAEQNLTIIKFFTYAQQCYNKTHYSVCEDSKRFYIENAAEATTAILEQAILNFNNCSVKSAPLTDRRNLECLMIYKNDLIYITKILAPNWIAFFNYNNLYMEQYRMYSLSHLSTCIDPFFSTNYGIVANSMLIDCLAMKIITAN